MPANKREAEKKPPTAPAAPAAPIPARNDTHDVDPDMPDGAKEVDDGDVDEILTLDIGDSFTGEYRGFKLTRSGKPDKQSKLHKFINSDGVAVGIWGSFQLDQKLERVGENIVVWVKYTGKADLASGNTLHTYRVAKLPAGLPF